MDAKEKLLSGDKEQVNRRLMYVGFIGAIAVLAAVNALFYYLAADAVTKQVLWLMDLFYALLFLADFFMRLYAAENKSHYMLHWGWLDLLTSIPGIPALRLLRGARAFFASRIVLAAAPDELAQEARSRLGESVLLVVVILGLIVVSVGSVGVVEVESGAPGASIETGYDAVWWSLVTISTVGYGDMVPVTPAGRIIGVFMIIVGVALFTTLTSYLASSFTDRVARRQREQQIELAAKNQQAMEAMMERLLRLEESIAGSLQVEEPVAASDDRGGEESP